ncbi:MAG TPA: carboxyvinyl-carboxyphosphonate phosphorylmutase [Pseudothermotoga sp.]|uniref:isocitrate lyase/PEP mutase family protein n=1 Tax=Pseudothermotoga lettingae TaxID=177758 RepID=UPI0007460160|nr:isocitrate lyase/PEP mutase family protein [Pseudothermotoga lettingae]KUK21613.1 MAG: Putative methylisocitrate lyase [Pseudothermotoga lettingae]HBT25371.1 carboxyvinyl-carboxyphosphonate phosphorylmutase [Pseudothermotoga sp.]
MNSKSFEKAKKLREYLQREGVLTLRVCAYDALSAVLIERAGFEVVGTTGYGISASLIGQPDIGLVGFAEMLERVRTIVNATELPVDADIDTGYGNALNVFWAVKNFARVGVAGIRLEDQVWPKRCGHMEGKNIVPLEEMINKIKAAIDAKNEENPEMVIGARTDARTVAGFEEVVRRAKAYAEAGADYVYVETPQSLYEIETLVREVSRPISFNIIPGGKTPIFELEKLAELGVKYLSVPMICLYPATKAIMEALNALKNKDLEKISHMGVNWSEFNEIVGIKKWNKLETKYSK